VACSGYKYQAFTTLGYSNGPMAVSMRWSYYPTIKAASVASNPASKEPGVLESYNLFSLSGSWELSRSLTLRAGIDNLFDVEPPLSGGSYAADGTFWTTTPPTLPMPALPSADARYDLLGRRYFAGFSLKL
jgi:outer membrane receptor protein involved in Fe transport